MVSTPENNVVEVVVRGDGYQVLKSRLTYKRLMRGISVGASP